MCSIFKCFGWALDLIQRIISFMMAGVIFCAICLGCIVAAGAGVAYGYNVSLAEFLDIKRSDVTVYVRRGQFSDRPEANHFLRRSGHDDSNELEYQEHKLMDDTKPLSEAWEKAQDTRNYADKLTKYSLMRPNIMRSNSNDEVGLLDEKVGDISSQTPALSATAQLVPELTQEELTMKRLYQDPLLRPTLPPFHSQNKISIHDEIISKTRRTQKPSKKKIPDINVEINDESVNLQPNLSKFLFSREDFEDPEEIDTIQKPL